MKRIGIIGAGRFGMSLAESLSNAGAEVILKCMINYLISA